MDPHATLQATQEPVADKGLKPGALGLIASTVIGIASTAPAYSMAATLGFVVVGVGLQAPILVILSFVPMWMIAVSYRELNSAEPDCGTVFTWGARTFGARAGWMGGWAIIAADVIVMASQSQVGATYTYLLFGARSAAGSTNWTLLAGVLWIVAMTAICYLGIEISARVQYALLGIELVMLALFSVVALVRVYTGHHPAGSIHVTASWFNPFHVHSFNAFAATVLIAIFIYWGWDSAGSVNEETMDARRIPGKAMVLGTVVLLLTFALVTVSAQSFAGVGTTGHGLANKDNSSDVISGLGSAVFGSSGIGWLLSKLLILMVMSSSVAATLTTILPTARTSLAMSSYKAIPARFSRIHPRFLIPTWATVAMGVVSIAFYVLMTEVSKNVLQDTITATGMMVAFYYGLTGITCVWYFRRVLTRSPRDLLRKGVIPGLGGALLLALFGYACYQYSQPSYGVTSWTVPGVGWHVGGVFLVGVGALLLGAVLMAVWNLIAPDYFRGLTLPRATPPR
jgi:amino acid transporter